MIAGLVFVSVSIVGDSSRVNKAVSTVQDLPQRWLGGVATEYLCPEQRPPSAVGRIVAPLIRFIFRVPLYAQIHQTQGTGWSGSQGHTE